MGSINGEDEPGSREGVGYNDYFYDVHFKDRGQGWVVGYWGKIFYTADKGKTWEPQETGTKQSLFSIEFAGNEIAWAVGKSGCIIHTEDGGKTWVSQRSDVEVNLNGVSFIDEETGWAVGERGTVIHTTDGGMTWTHLWKGGDQILSGVQFVDAKTGWIVGERGTILHSEDGGKSWLEMSESVEDFEITVIRRSERGTAPAPLRLGDLSLSDVCLDPGGSGAGWITGMEGLILKTIDRGQTWRKVYSEPGTYLFRIAMSDGRLCVVGSRGKILVSEDGGDTWTSAERVPTQFWLAGVDLVNQKEGWVVGGHGGVYYTDDGGRQWTSKGIQF